MGHKRVVSWGFFWVVRSKSRHGTAMLLSHGGASWVAFEPSQIEEMVRTWKDRDEAERWLIQKKLVCDKPEFDQAEVVEMELMVNG